MMSRLFTGLYLAIIITHFMSAGIQADETAASPNHNPRIQPSHISPQGIPVFTNDSFRQQATVREDPQTVYAGLKNTCDFWSKKYRQIHSELARVNMNSACRDASSYAEARLNKIVKPNYAAYQPSQKKKSKSGKVAYSGRQAEASEKSCQIWHQAIKKINRQLRAGYKESKGNKLRAKRRALSDRIYQHC